MTKKNQNQKSRSEKRAPKRKILEGKVVSDKMQQTVVIEVETKRSHPLYKKIMKTSKRYKAHSDQELKMGQIVKIEQCRPLSKQKQWKVIEVGNK